MVPHGGGRPTRSGDHASLPSAETLPREAPAPHVSLLAQAALFPVPGWQVPLFGRPEENQLVELPVLRPCTGPPPPALPGLSTVLLLPSAALVHSAHLVPPPWIHPGVPGAPPLRCSPSCWPEAGPGWGCGPGKQPQGSHPCCEVACGRDNGPQLLLAQVLLPDSHIPSSGSGEDCQGHRFWLHLDLSSGTRLWLA